MAVKRVMVIRPGETEWNKIGRWQGHVAVPLNELGRAQAERLGRFMQPIGVNALYSSDLRRARDTAQIISQHTGVKPIFDQRLRERAMGEWQGLVMDDIISWYPQEYERLQADPEGFQVPGGESRRQVIQRVQTAFNDIVARGGEVITIISHTTALRLLLDALVPETDPYRIQFHNMSVTTLINENDTWRISQLDDVSHLEGMQSDPFYHDKGANKV